MKFTCRGISKGRERCQAKPLRDSDFCFWHDPAHTGEADKARSLGGQRQRREKFTEGAYDLQGLDSVEGIRRVIEGALIDLMGIENSVARSRALISGALAAAKLLEVGEKEERLAAVQAALGPRVVKKVNASYVDYRSPPARHADLSPLQQATLVLQAIREGREPDPSRCRIDDEVQRRAFNRNMGLLWVANHQLVRATLVAAREHAARLRDLTEPAHRRLCEHLAETVVAVFTEACRATEGFLQYHQKRDANHSAMIYGLSIRRDAFVHTCLFIRVDPFHRQTWWQLHDGAAVEHALGGWWNIPILDVEDYDAFVQEKVVDLIRTLRESPSAYRSRF